MQEGLVVFMRTSKIKSKYDAEVQQTAGYRTIPWPAGQGRAEKWYMAGFKENAQIKAGTD